MGKRVSQSLINSFFSSEMFVKIVLDNRIIQRDHAMLKVIVPRISCLDIFARLSTASPAHSMGASDEDCRKDSDALKEGQKIIGDRMKEVLSQTISGDEELNNLFSIRWQCSYSPESSVYGEVIDEKIKEVVSESKNLVLLVKLHDKNKGREFWLKHFFEKRLEELASEIDIASPPGWFQEILEKPEGIPNYFKPISFKIFFSSQAWVEKMLKDPSFLPKFCRRSFLEKVLELSREDNAE